MGGTMRFARRNNRFIAAIAAGFLLVAAACGGSESSDGERDRNVSGGAVASQSAHPAPYQVVVFRMTDETLARPWTDWRGDWGIVCGGVILSSRWIATTANCVSTYGAPWDKERFRIGVGMVDPWQPITYENEPKHMFGIEKALTGGSWENWALLKTDREIDFSQFTTVRPIDLPFGLDDSWPAKGTTGQISGYGARSAGINSVGTLRTALVEVLSDVGDSSCGTWDSYVSESRICLGKAAGPQGGLACNQDWGGPVVVNVENRPVLAGIISEVDRLGSCSNEGATLAIRARSLARWAAGGAINDFVATPDDQAVNLTWSKPYAAWFPYAEDPEWDPVPFDYVVEMSEDGGKTWFTIADGKSTETSVEVGGLENGKEYAFRVAALNEIVVERSDYRYYSPVAKVTVGKQEQPVAVPDLPPLEPETPPAAAPTLSGQDPQGAMDIATNPAQPTGTPSTVPATAGGATPTTAPSSGGSSIVSVASTELSTFNPIGAADVAKLAKADVPTGARVSVTVDKASKKVCVIKGATVVALSAGKCKVKVAVATGKGKPKSKTTTITVKK
ncbi:MAG: trypsin-like serine protease [Acidobacteria bacterium]|nr:trypsin-like serine protease [Acidobacteriota bacterium]